MTWDALKRRELGALPMVSVLDETLDLFRADIHAVCEDL